MATTGSRRLEEPGFEVGTRQSSLLSRDKLLSEGAANMTVSQAHTMAAYRLQLYEGRAHILPATRAHSDWNKEC